MIVPFIKKAIQEHIRFWNRSDPDLEAQREKLYQDLEDAIVQLIDKRIKKLAKPK